MNKKRKFIIFHLSLVPIREPVFDTINLQREDWLRRSLKGPFEFRHRDKTNLYWVPRDDVDECIFGVIEQKKPHWHHTSPEAGGRETISEEWQGAYVLLDPTYHDEGQRVAVEIDEVGTPTALLKSLLTHLNQNELRPFTIEAEPVFDGNAFWSFAERHANILKYVSFEFVVPNMWGTESELEKDLKSTGEQTGAEKVRIKIEAQDGVSVKNQKITDGVSYAERGAGKITAKSVDGKPFSSENRPRTTEILRTDGAESETRDEIAQNKGRVLGRDQS